MRLKGTLAVFAAVVALTTATDARADIFAVNDTGDGSDLLTSDNAPNDCDASADPGLQCTLRAAIEEANATAGEDLIAFNIPGGGVMTFTPASAYPSLSEAVTINGYTQPGSSANTQPLGKPLDTVLRIEIDGGSAGSAVNGLTLASAGSTVRGLDIHSFDGSGIFTANSSTIRGNFIGVDPSGTNGFGNTFAGIFAGGGGGTQTTVGGPSRSAANLVSANGAIGINSNGPAQIQGNYVGTAADGKSALPNGNAEDTTNSESIVVYGANTSVIGNVMAFNFASGMSVAATGPVLISENRIFGNAELGIDHDFDRVQTPNDPLDADTGPNGLQNHPVIDNAVTNKKKTVISGRLPSAAGRQYTIELFFNRQKEDQGERLIGAVDVVTDEAGDSSFVFQPPKRIKSKGFITATATDVDVGQTGATSEFSTPKKLKLP